MNNPSPNFTSPTTGRVFAHRREPNGAQFIYPVSDPLGSMTDAEWNDYEAFCREQMALRFPRKAK